MRVTQSATRLGSLPSLLRLRQSPRRLRPALRPLAPDWPPLPSALSLPTQGPENLQTQICLAPSPAHTSIQENTPSPQWGSHSRGPHHPQPIPPTAAVFLSWALPLVVCSPPWEAGHSAWSSPLPRLPPGHSSCPAVPLRRPFLHCLPDSGRGHLTGESSPCSPATAASHCMVTCAQHRFLSSAEAP